MLRTSVVLVIISPRCNLQSQSQLAGRKMGGGDKLHLKTNQSAIHHHCVAALWKGYGLGGLLVWGLVLPLVHSDLSSLGTNKPTRSMYTTTYGNAKGIKG